MSHHFFIGLGGTGGRILAELRKIIRQEYPNGRGEPKDTPTAEPEARLGYLYVDSSSREFDDLEMWRVFGESVQLEQTQKLFIKSGDLGAAVRQINDFKAIKPWIGENKALRVTFENTNGTAGANQVRRYGRGVFANKSPEYPDTVSRELNRLTAGAVGKVTFHICGTLAGGTASGSILDAALIVRELCPRSENFPIYLYALVTDAEVKEKGVVTGNFYANQYAALQELNQFWLNRWSPHLLTGAGQRADALYDRFQACYLITDKNQNNLTLSRVDQEQLIAEYLFHRSITLASAAMPDRLPKTWSHEDVAKFKEHHGQCYRFSSLGVKRWVVPTSEIQEKLDYDFMASATRQMLYNNWHRDHGYLDKKRDIDIPHEVAKSEECTTWRISEDQLKLNHGYELTTNLDPVPSWKDTWKDTVTGAANALGKDGTQQSQWVASLQQSVDSYYHKNFRDRGVEKFYRERLEEVPAYASAIRKAVETDLFRLWRNGTYGLHEVRQILEWLKIELERREGAVADQEADVAGRINEGNTAIRNGESHWHNAVKWSWLPLFGKPAVQRQWSNFQRRLTGLMIDRTELAALPFKRRLLEEAKKQIIQLTGLVATSAKKLEDLGSGFSKGAAARCAAGQERKFDSRHVREYNAQQVEEATHDLRVSKEAQSVLGEAVRGEIERILSPTADFNTLRQRIESDDLKRVLEIQAHRCASEQHDILAAQGRYPDLLDAGIIDILRERYGRDEERLRLDVESFINYAASAYEVDAAQKQPNTDAESAAWEDAPQRHIAVFLPIANNTADAFEKSVRERFERAATHVEVVYSERRKEITVIATDFFLTPRFFRTVKGLKDRYEQRLAPVGATAEQAPEIKAAAMREIHLEDFTEGQLADLFLPIGTA